MCQGTDRDDVDPACGHRLDVFQGYPAGSLDQRSSVDDSTASLHGFRAHIIEHDDVDPAAEALSYLLDGVGFDFDSDGVRDPAPDPLAPPLEIEPQAAI